MESSTETAKRELIKWMRRVRGTTEQLLSDINRIEDRLVNSGCRVSDIEDVIRSAKRVSNELKIIKVLNDVLLGTFLAAAKRTNPDDFV